MNTIERRRAVLRAVVAIEAVPMMALPVRAYHVQHFGLPECVDERPQTIGADLRWLEGEGYLRRPNHWHSEFVSTEAGQRWARAERDVTVCLEPCCADARERKAAWAEYMSFVRVIVRARTGQRIVGREPGCPPTR